MVVNGTLLIFFSLIRGWKTAEVGRWVMPIMPAMMMDHTGPVALRFAAPLLLILWCLHAGLGLHRLCAVAEPMDLVVITLNY